LLKNFDYFNYFNKNNRLCQKFGEKIIEYLMAAAGFCAGKASLEPSYTVQSKPSEPRGPGFDFTPVGRSLP